MFDKEENFKLPTLGVNIDHVATIRQARHSSEPSLIVAAALAELGGANGITLHLREDRRHIQDRDVYLIKETIQTRLNLEIAATEEMIKIALDIKPDCITLVPEKRKEITTEGGLDVKKNLEHLKRIVSKIQDNGASASLFIDSDEDQIQASASTKAKYIELHTGKYVNSMYSKQCQDELKLLKLACHKALDLGIKINAGHGLNYNNVYPVACLPGIKELNIGHTIISRAVLVGMERAVKEMKLAIKGEL
ncbi:MAG: pyridoxine 5'-phosphate synthase [Candidatus Atelocyanobacterium thalassa]